MGNTPDTSKTPYETRVMFGRRMITSGAREITRENVANELLKAITTHNLNRSEIEYLWQYYKGNQPILNRIKTVRPEICNRIVENRANEIVSFKVGYLCGEPIQYVSRTGEEESVSGVNQLNEWMFAEDKASQDQEVVEWQMICGTAYRMVLADEIVPQSDDEIAEVYADEAPFEMYTLDPRNTFIVYSNDIAHDPLMAVKYVADDQNQNIFTIYTNKFVFEVINGIVTSVMLNTLGVIPIFEYPANNARLGSFEIVLPLLDEMNNLDSNRMDGVEQVIQAFIKFINCDIDLTEYEEFLAKGAIKVSSSDGRNADVDTVTTDLNQSQSQTLKEDVYQTILTICGMPNRNGGSSTSDTGAAVLLRDGWSLAEARAKDSEHMFKKAERKMLRLVLKICREKAKTLPIPYLRDINMQFTRRNYENIQSKSQVLDTMLNNPKVHPLLAFESCGLFIDPEQAYKLSMDYYEEQMNRWEPVEVDDDDETEEDVRVNGQFSEGSEEETQA